MTLSTGRRRGSPGLFWRIYLTFVLTVVVFAGLAGLAIWRFSGEYSAEWVESVATAVHAREEALLAGLEDRARLEREVAALATELDLRVAIRDARGELLAGDPATRSPRSMKMRQSSRLRRGEPVVGRGDRGPALILPLRADDETLVAAIYFDTGDGDAERRALLAVALLGLLMVLGSGAWPLARSLTRRLAALEQGAERIARGELAHRVAERGGNDEVDRLGHAFNVMAGRLEAMMRSQKMLLTNVSHELRTPVARMRVLTELLGERVAALPDAEHPAARRLGKGIGELGEDLVEMEALIGDLLTSGKLELAARPSGAEGPAIPRTHTPLLPLLTKVAGRVDATVQCAPEDLAVEADGLLLERLLANLLTNARRACPDGQVVASARRDGDAVVLAVEDEGPGIAPEDRGVIFDPFTRLDAARARDQGGVGLGLYLCRQIAEAHGGTIAAEDRADGRRGARLAVRLPRA
ncbi:MAG: HAMP domain-containing protein [Myxococcales bacterium]|nr:HAMP domain-containing protein [Myxococcales bacterium]